MYRFWVQDRMYRLWVHMTYSAQTEEMKILLSWLKNNRIEKELTMRDLAERLETQHSFVQKVENGERRLDLIEYLRYCQALEVDPIEGMRKVQNFVKARKLAGQ